jgi:hypothetical protein
MHNIAYQPEYQFHHNSIFGLENSCVYYIMSIDSHRKNCRQLGLVLLP